MRPIAFVLATFFASGPAVAQSWEEYSYPDYAISVAFPVIDERFDSSAESWSNGLSSRPDRTTRPSLPASSFT